MHKLIQMKRITTILLAAAALWALLAPDASAQATFTTRKEKRSDLMLKTTKVVLTGNDILDESFKEEVISRWRICRAAHALRSTM